ncbi:uncharacterized protein LOC130844009 [Hippopotamus amphibius kiboko]|uniref:uncharacterized protein LOC130844009 n=1 Tax=Hippopotamus amphibius kiboko TaxID=575201 RepID=UPI002594B491|nr:uncharacterized protein LOC130844009 [Hippopotamus amphibius kiboko]
MGEYQREPLLRSCAFSVEGTGGQCRRKRLLQVPPAAPLVSGVSTSCPEHHLQLLCVPTHLPTGNDSPVPLKVALLTLGVPSLLQTVAFPLRRYTSGHRLQFTYFQSVASSSPSDCRSALSWENQQISFPSSGLHLPSPTRKYPNSHTRHEDGLKTIKTSHYDHKRELKGNMNVRRGKWKTSHKIGQEQVQDPRSSMNLEQKKHALVEFYLQEPYQVLMVNVGEKSLMLLYSMSGFQQKITRHMKGKRHSLKRQSNVRTRFRYGRDVGISRLEI